MQSHLNDEVELSQKVEHAVESWIALPNTKVYPVPYGPMQLERRRHIGPAMLQCIHGEEYI